MLSQILSRLFQLAFWIILIFSLPNLYVQLSNEPIRFKNSRGNSTSYGEPGIILTGLNTSADNTNAPDTGITYTARRRDDSTYNSSAAYNPANLPPRGSITWSSSQEGYFHNKATVDSTIRSWRSMGDTVITDTQINLILARNEDALGHTDKMSVSTEKLADGRMVITKSGIENNKVTVPARDTFPDEVSAGLFAMAGRTKNDIIIKQQGFRYESLVLKAAGTKQHIIFVLYHILIILPTMLLMLTLSRLFRNFHRHEYFTAANVKLLRKAGIFLLLPQLVYLVFYWTVLFHLDPVKFTITGSAFADVKQVASYQFESGIEYHLVFLALGILILSYIFKNGLSLQRDLDYTV